MLDLDAMKQSWMEHDRKLDESIRLNRQLLRGVQLDKARSALGRMRWMLGVEAAVWFVIDVWLGNFAYVHLGSWQLVGCALACAVYAIGMMAGTIRLMVCAGDIAYGGEVTAIQRQLTEVRMLRIRLTQWGVLAGVMVWAPALVVLCGALLRLDGFSPVWIWVNVGFGVMLALLVAWVSRRFGERMKRVGWMQRMMEDLGGSSLKAATGFLGELAVFVGE